MADNFSVSKDSIQLPYRRFLADSAAGLSLLLIAVAIYYLPLVSSAPLRDAWVAYSHGRGIGTEVKVLILLLLFLLATPIGFAANALSWLLIDYSICMAERRYFTWSRQNGRIFPLWDVTASRFGHVLTRYFELTKDNFNTAGWFFRDVLEAYLPDHFETQTHIKGLVVFLRNLTLFCLILAFVALGNGVQDGWGMGAVVAAAIGLIFLLTIRPRSWVVLHWLAAAVTAGGLGFAFWQAQTGPLDTRAAILFAIATGTVIVIGMVEYYYHDAILLHAYFACHEYGVAAPPPNTEDRILRIAEELIRKIRKAKAKREKEK